jgi:hypothetical protein
MRFILILATMLLDGPVCIPFHLGLLLANIANKSWFCPLPLGKRWAKGKRCRSTTMIFNHTANEKWTDGDSIWNTAMVLVQAYLINGDSNFALNCRFNGCLFWLGDLQQIVFEILLGCWPRPNWSVVIQTLLWIEVVYSGFEWGDGLHL